MPGGYFHQIVTMVAVVPVTVGVATATGNFGSGLDAGLGCLVGVIINPDLDLVAANRVLRLIFWPYRAAIPHRSLLSHSPVMGTLIRITYIWLLLIIPCTIFNIPWPDPTKLGWVWVGLGISDFLHIFADAFY